MGGKWQRNGFVSFFFLKSIFKGEFMTTQDLCAEGLIKPVWMPREFDTQVKRKKKKTKVSSHS